MLDLRPKPDSWSWINMVKKAARPRFVRPLLAKVYARFGELVRGSHQKEVAAWCAAQAENADAFARSLDPDLWAEATAFSENVEATTLRTIRAERPELSGAAHIRLLYFLVRHAKPDCAVETGVAAGFSSLAILSAMKANKQGRLYSSDLPYFRLGRGEEDIGCAVKGDLRKDWQLFVKGDSANLKEILPLARSVDLLHYDSGKSYVERRAVLTQVAPYFSSRKLLVMDDIQDNWFFRDFVRGRYPFRIFQHGGKYVGVLGV
jgi:predicted O-methyltransferase YrrM